MAHDMGRVFGRIIFRIAPALLLIFVYGVINLVSMGSAPRHYCNPCNPGRIGYYTCIYVLRPDMRREAMKRIRAFGKVIVLSCSSRPDRMPQVGIDCGDPGRT